MDITKWKEFFQTDKFAANAGVELLEVKPGFARAKMLVTKEHLNAGGVCQGGALFTLADLAFAAAANSHQQLTLSVSANITFLRSVKEGYVYAEAVELFNHHRIPFLEVRITDEVGELVAVMTSSGYRKSVEILKGYSRNRLKLHTFVESVQFLRLFRLLFVPLRPNQIDISMNYSLLKGKRGIIFGALNEQSIAWKVAEKAVENGAVITLSNTPVAVRMGATNALAEKLNCEVIPADATSVADLENVFKRSMEVLGGQIDFVLHSIGMSPNVRKRRTYDDLDYDMLEKTLDISAVSFHKMIQAAKKLDAIADYGSILALSYVAAQRTFYGYNDMADAKALLESIARSFGYIYGREHHVRVNTISQSPTMTTAGSGVKGMDKLFDFANRMSPLGNASAEECADYCIVMFSDLTRKVTMQNLYHDGGFSSVGMSLRAMATYEKGLEEYMDENGNIIYG